LVYFVPVRFECLTSYASYRDKKVVGVFVRFFRCLTSSWKLNNVGVNDSGIIHELYTASASTSIIEGQTTVCTYSTGS
jgi:hypothetical protein